MWQVSVRQSGSAHANASGQMACRCAGLTKCREWYGSRGWSRATAPPAIAIMVAAAAAALSFFTTPRPPSKVYRPIQARADQMVCAMLNSPARPLTSSTQRIASADGFSVYQSGGHRQGEGRWRLQGPPAFHRGVTGARIEGTGHAPIRHCHCTQDRPRVGLSSAGGRSNGGTEFFGSLTSAGGRLSWRARASRPKSVMCIHTTCVAFSSAVARRPRTKLARKATVKPRASTSASGQPFG
jgi:hypothetical protein